MEALRKRSEVPVEDTWELEDLYPTIEDWEKEAEELKALCGELAGYAGRLGESAGVMAEFYEKNDRANLLIERLVVYADQKLHEDLGNNGSQSRSGRAAGLSVQLSQAVSFEEPEILAIGEEKIAGFQKENETLAGLTLYFSRIFREKSHILSAEVEEIMAQTRDISSAPNDIYSILNNVEIKFPVVEDEDGNKIELTQERYGTLMESRDRKVRKEAFTALYQTYGRYINTIATTFQANLKQERFYANVRRFPSARAMELFSGNIPETVYDNLIDCIHEALPQMHRYVALRKKILGVDELHMYDVYTPIADNYSARYTFEEAKEIVLKGLAPMGEEYLSILKEGFDNRWIDVYENEGKLGGAYSWGAYGTHPYVLLNYQGNLDNVFTLAHEMGHALHSYYSDRTQPHVYAGYLLFVAEVASTCNEALLIRYLIEHAESKEEKMYLLNHFLEQFKGTMYRQTMFAEFEKIVHERAGKGESLSAEDFNAVYLDLNKQYFGPDMVSDPEIAMEWAKIPHFYTPFYVYQYATGFAAAMALSARILKLGGEGVKDYMKFLTGGCSKDPIELLRMAGVDMEKKEPVQEALAVFADLLDQFEALV